MTRALLTLQLTRPFHRLGLNSFWLLFARISSQALALVFTAAVARQLGAAGLGEYTVIVSVVYIGNAFTTFGTDTLLIRELARTRNTRSDLLPAVFWLQLALSVGFISVLISVSRGEPALIVFSLSLVPLAFYSVYSAVLRGFERMDLYLRLTLAASAAQLLAGALILAIGGDLMALMWALLAGQVVSAATGGILCNRSVGQVHLVRRVPITLAPVLRIALPFALLTTCALLYSRLGVFALTLAGADAAAGWLSAAARVVETVKIAPQAILGALFPLLAGMRTGGRALAATRASLAASLVFCIVAALALSLLAVPIVRAIYGDRFAPSTSALAILPWALVPYAVSSNMSLQLISRGREWHVLFVTIGALLISLVFLRLLTPHFGLIGTCWGIVASEWAQAILFLGASTLSLQVKSLYGPRN